MHDITRTHTYTCAVEVSLTWAPEGKLLATIQMLRSIPKKRTDNPAWQQAWTQRNNAQWAAIRQQNAANTTAYYTALNNQIVSNGEAFRNQMNGQFQIHEQQMAVARQNSDNNLQQQQQQHWDAQQRHTDDVVDSVLNQQKRYDPTTGQIYKSASAYTYNWVSADGKQYYPTRARGHEVGRNLRSNVWGTVIYVVHNPCRLGVSRRDDTRKPVAMLRVRHFSGLPVPTALPAPSCFPPPTSRLRSVCLFS